MTLVTFPLIVIPAVKWVGIDYKSVFVIKELTLPVVKTGSGLFVSTKLGKFKALTGRGFMFERVALF